MANRSPSTQPFSPLVRPGHARLTVVAGQCPHGMTFSLSARTHDAGRAADGVTLAEDTTVSSTHATFVYAGQGIEVDDLASLNGVYVRFTGVRELHDGDWFRVGNQVLRFFLVADRDHYAAPDGTLHFVSPHRSGAFRILHVLDGARAGASTLATGDELTIGAEGCDVSIVGDPYLSGRHARVFKNASGGYSIQDTGSTNGTYVRVRGRSPLAHGDLVYLGDTLLRVDIT